MKKAPGIKKSFTDDGSEGDCGRDDRDVDVGIVVSEIVCIREEFFEGRDIGDLVAIKKRTEGGVNAYHVNLLFVFYLQHL